jgi:hypothetical protein
MIIAVTALVLAALPLGLALDNLRRLKVPPLALGTPRISVLIPARNEAAHIGDAVAAVLASTGVELELCVLDDGSTDATPAILAGIDDARLRVLTGGNLPAGWSGKQHACARLAEAARHELMVFVDADVRLAQDALCRMAGFMQAHSAGSAELGLASGFPRQVTVGWSEWLLLPLIHLLLLGYLPMFRMQRDLSPALGAGCGQIFIARKQAYCRAGGHAAIRASLHDGVTLPRAFRRAGIMSGLFDATSLAQCRMYESTGAVWEGLTKNATEGMAKPLALPVWTVLLAGGHVAPFVLLAVAPSPVALAACSCAWGLRVVLAWRFRQPWRSVLLHPVGVTALLALQWAALLRASAGVKATWRGRAYTAQG